jgi:hypothetical protein
MRSPYSGSLIDMRQRSCAGFYFTHLCIAKRALEMSALLYNNPARFPIGAGRLFRLDGYSRMLQAYLPRFVDNAGTRWAKQAAKLFRDDA